MIVHSNGMGVQSITIAAMACLGDLPMPDVSIFADTGWEGKETIRHAKLFTDWARGYGMEVITVSVGNIREDALNPEKRWASMPLWTKTREQVYEMCEDFDCQECCDGQGHLAGWTERTSILQRQCTNEYKITAVKKEIRKRLGLSPGQRAKEPVSLWLGISLDEVIRMKESRDRWLKNSWPLIEKRMDRRDCIAYLEKNGMIVPPKSACIGCPYRSDASWREMKEQRPDEFADAVDFDKRVRRVRPGVLSPVYLHRSLNPLDEVDFAKNAPDMFGEECGGHCGL